MFKMPGNSYQGAFLPLSPQEQIVRDSLEKHVTYLSSIIGERNILSEPSLQASADYIFAELNKTGLDVSYQDFEWNNKTIRNVIAEKKGEIASSEIVVIGAHYDSVPHSPGADDNASGVAAVLVLAALLKDFPLSRTTRFVAFANEEPPFFFSKNMGSWHYANRSYQNKENILAMFSLESIGYYSEEKHSQHYPFPFNFFYPSVGNYIGFVGNMKSHRLVHAAIESFRKQVQFPSEGISAPWWIPGIGWSDQLSFWRHGYDAIMITGTALYRNPNYHTARDLPEFLDFSRMARVVHGLSNMFIELEKLGSSVIALHEK